jgi:heme-degrading monooxygenase HmoA
MVVVVFRAKVVPGVEQELVALAERMYELVSGMPSFVSYKDFAAEDGENGEHYAFLTKGLPLTPS